MKLKTKLGCLCCLATTIVTSAAAIVMNNEKVAAQNKEATYDYHLEKEAMKYVALNDIDASTGRLKDGVIYNVGGDGVYLTSNGIVEYAVNQTNDGMARTVTNKPQITVLPSTVDTEVLFSNNVILDFDISHDESNLYVETKRNKLVSRTYKEHRYYETKSRLVWKSYRKKVWFVWVTIWYLDTEYYQSEVIERTPVEVYQEEKSRALTINLEEDKNLIAKTVGSVVDNKMPQLRTISNEYGIPVTILFLSTIISVAKTIFLQILSIIAEFIPVLDEVKTSFETIKGYDMFTGEKIELGWRIFGGIMLLVGAVTAVFTFGASMAIVDVAADGATVTKKLVNVGEGVAKTGEGVKSLANGLENVGDIAKKSDAIKDTSKTVGNIKIKKAKLNSDATFSKNRFKRGFEIDEFAGNIKNGANTGEIVGLGRTAKTFDVLDTQSKTMVSVKSLDTRLPTYQDPSKFRSVMKKYIDVADYSKMDDIYNGTTQASKGLEKGIDFTRTGVDLYIPKSGLTSDQAKVIADLTKNLPKNFVLNIIELS